MLTLILERQLLHLKAAGIWGMIKEPVGVCFWWYPFWTIGHFQSAQHRALKQ